MKVLIALLSLCLGAALAILVTAVGAYYGSWNGWFIIHGPIWGLWLICSAALFWIFTARRRRNQER